MMDCSMMQNIAHQISLVKECDVVRSGALRMETPFMYPNGSYVDVFLDRTEGLFQGNYTLSDYGQTGVFLENAQVKLGSTQIGSTQRRRQILRDVCDELHVAFRQGTLLVEIAGNEVSDISDAIFRLSQACVRISDLASHQRLRSANPYRDDLEEFFEASGIKCVSDFKLDGPWEREVRVDLELDVSPKPILLLAIRSNERTIGSRYRE